MTMDSDHGGGRPDNIYCKHCADEAGNLKSRDEVREGMIAFYQQSMGKTREEAEREVDIHMAQMPAWSGGQPVTPTEPTMPPAPAEPTSSTTEPIEPEPPAAPSSPPPPPPAEPTPAPISQPTEPVAQAQEAAQTESAVPAGSLPSEPPTQESQ